MTRYGPQFGPDITFLGVDRVDLDDPTALAAADVVVVGAPFDGGTSHRPGTRFGPMAIRQTDYLPHDGSRPHLALRVDALQDVRVVDAGDVEIPPGEIEFGEPCRTRRRGNRSRTRSGFETGRSGRASSPRTGSDIDVCEPGHAPGTGTPEPGGLSSRQLLAAVRRICLEALSGLAAREHGISHDPAGPLLEGR